MKVYLEGEWKVRQHGISKRRTWRKLHLAVCPNSHESIFELLTDHTVADCEVYPELLDAMPRSVKRTYGDGAYETERCYAANQRHVAIPILEILGLGGDDEATKLWKKLKGYHTRSLGETAMFRFKRLFVND